MKGRCRNKPVCVHASTLVKNLTIFSINFFNPNGDQAWLQRWLPEIKNKIAAWTTLFYLAQFHSALKALNGWVQGWCFKFAWWLLLKQILFYICSLLFIVRIGAKHQELRQRQLRGLSEFSAGPGGPDIDDDEVDPNYARVNHFREAYPPGGIYRPSSPAVGETFVYLRDSSSAPMEREHLEGLYAKINKQHYPQTSGDR